MSGVSPGGSAVSSLKKRRLAALSQALGTKSAAPAPASKSAKPTSDQGSKPLAKPSAPNRGKNKRPAPQEEAPKSDAFPYQSLPPELIQGPVGRSLGLTQHDASLQGEKTAAGVEQLLQMLLSMGKQGALGRNTGEIIADRVVDKVVVLDNPSTKPAIGSLKKKATRVHSEHLFRGQARKAQFKQAAASATFSAVAQVHEVWRTYAAQQLGNNPIGAEEKLLQMDLHGAFIRVARCKQRQLEGLEGLVFHISSTTLHIVTPDNRRHFVPLAATIFSINLGDKFEAVVSGQNLTRAWNKQTPVPIRL